MSSPAPNHVEPAADWDVMGAARWVDSPGDLRVVIDAAGAAKAYAVDTEFHRERTYWPQLALVQLAWADEVALIDPLRVDVAPLADLLEGPGVTVMHAASQDLEVLDLACGTIPARLFDTQLAAGFIGMSNASLATLVDRLLHVRLPKSDRLTDWLHRPLGEEQLDYAAADVVHLLDMRRLLCEQLDARGRLAWAEDECEQLRTRPLPERDPMQAWRRVKEARALRGRARAVAQSVAAWREKRAARLDQPPRFILSDLSLVGIANRPPSTVEGLARVRGFDARAARGAVGTELLAAVRKGLDAAPPTSGSSARTTTNIDGKLRPVVGLVSSWIGQLSRDLQVDAGLLATRADVEAFLAGDPDARLRHGWRAELVGEGIDRLQAGTAALAFDPSGHLVLEPREPH
jgi:ribonuclease D